MWEYVGGTYFLQLATDTLWGNQWWRQLGWCCASTARCVSFSSGSGDFLCTLAIWVLREESSTTPWKISMEPGNHLIWKGKSSSKPALLVFQRLIFRGVMVNLGGLGRALGPFPGSLKMKGCLLCNETVCPRLEGPQTTVILTISWTIRNTNHLMTPPKNKILHEFWEWGHADNTNSGSWAVGNVGRSPYFTFISLVNTTIILSTSEWKSNFHFPLQIAWLPKPKKTPGMNSKMEIRDLFKFRERTQVFVTQEFATLRGSACFCWDLYLQ